MQNPFRYFNSSPEVIRLVVMMYVRYPLSLRQVEDLLFERGIDICHETVRFWWNRLANSATVCSPFTASKATRALKSAVYCLRFLIADLLSLKTNRHRTRSLRHCPIPGEYLTVTRKPPLSICATVF